MSPARRSRRSLRIEAEQLSSGPTAEIAVPTFGRSTVIREDGEGTNARRANHRKQQIHAV